jgi:hypothetical protein
MTEKLIPLLRNIKTKEPSVTMAALDVYAEIGKQLGHEIVASDILPSLWPMTVGVLLSMDQVEISEKTSNLSLIACLVSFVNWKQRSLTSKSKNCKPPE